MEFHQTDPVILYDGHCLLCSRSVSVLTKIDKKIVFKFAPQQGDYFRSLIARDPSLIKQESIILIKKGIVHTRSSAVLAIFKELPFPWKIFYLGILIPKSMRDAIYVMVAKKRKKWFGQSVSCYIGDEQQKKRFLP